MSSKATSGNVRKYDVDANASIVECVLNPYEIIALLKVIACICTYSLIVVPEQRTLLAT